MIKIWNKMKHSAVAEYITYGVLALFGTIALIFTIMAAKNLVVDRMEWSQVDDGGSFVITRTFDKETCEFTKKKEFKTIEENTVDYEITYYCIGDGIQGDREAYFFYDGTNNFAMIYEEGEWYYEYQ